MLCHLLSYVADCKEERCDIKVVPLTLKLYRYSRVVTLKLYAYSPSKLYLIDSIVLCWARRELRVLVTDREGRKKVVDGPNECLTA